MGLISCLPRELVEPLWWITDNNYVRELTNIMWAQCVVGEFHRNSYKYTFRHIHHITAIRSNTPIKHCSIFFLWTIPICDLWSVACSLSHHLSKRNGFPGWRHRLARPTLLVTLPCNHSGMYFSNFKNSQKIEEKSYDYILFTNVIRTKRTFLAAKKKN